MKIIFLLAFIFVNIISYAQDEFRFKNLNIEDGLSQSSILDILQDKDGFIWIATFNGLNRYDGYDFKVFVNDPEDSTSISENVITSIFEDKNGNIWAGTFNGVLNKYDRSKGNFSRHDIKSIQGFPFGSGYETFEYPVPFMLNANATITDIVDEDGGDLLIGTWGNGLVKYNPDTGTLISYFHRPTDSLSLSSNYLTKIIHFQDGKFLIGTYGGGLNLMTPSVTKSGREKSNFNRLKFTGENNHKILAINIIDGIIWVGTQLNGIAKLRIEDGNIQQVFDEYLTNSDMNNFPIMSIANGIDNETIIGTYGGGIYRLSENGNKQNFRYSANNNNSLCDDEVVCLFTDKTGVVWVGTSIGSGISLLKKREQKFNTVNKNSLPIKINDNVVWAINEDKDEQLWVGTYRGGINIINRNTNSVKILKHEETNNSISADHVRSLCEDYKGNMWIGTFSKGLDFYDSKNKRFRNFQNIVNDKNSLPFNHVQSIMIDKDSILWCGLYGGGLSKLNLKDFYQSGNAKFYNYNHIDSDTMSLSDDRVYALYQDSQDNIWVATFGGGLNRFDKTSDKFVRYKSNNNNDSSLSDDKVISLYESSNGTLWVGTYGGGLNQYISEEDKFIRYSELVSFPDDAVYAILEDELQNLWISSDKGLAKFNPSNKSISVFGIADGLQSLEFSGGAFCKTKNNELVFGGINGLNYFSPQQVRLKSSIPSIVITQMKILDRELEQIPESIELTYNQNFFSFKFAVLDFTNPDNNQYSYILENFDKNWRFSDSRNRIANYTNVPPGEYKFIVKGANWEGLWNDEGVEVKIIITPPFYTRWWFVGLVALLSLSIIVGGILFYFSNKLILEKLKTKISADLHDNVGAGLTEISIMSELAAYSISLNPKNSEEKINMVSESARKLIDVMSDIVWAINPEKDSLHDLVVRLKHSYYEMAENMGITLTVNDFSSLKKVKLPIDVKQNIFLIIKEALNNSVKHSKCKYINLDINHSNGIINVVLYDDGIGFQKNDDNLGNGLININNRAKELKADIQIITDIGKGTKIKLTCDIRNRKRFKRLFLHGDV